MIWDALLTLLDNLDVTEGGKGLVASQDISVGDVVLEIPRELVISGEGFDYTMVCNKLVFFGLVKSECPSEDLFLTKNAKLKRVLILSQMPSPFRFLFAFAISIPKSMLRRT